MRKGWRCARCSHEWVPRVEAITPLVCPKCKSPYWNKARRNTDIREPGP
jgi:DNA-directed RNA polymerase subunit RPC12/RpoP